MHTRNVTRVKPLPLATNRQLLQSASGLTWLARMLEACEVADLGDQSHRRQGVDTAKATKPSDQRLVRLLVGLLGDQPVERRHAGQRLLECGQVLGEHDLCERLVEALSAKPNAVPGLSGVTSIAAGGSDVCAVMSDGTVQCWGRNDYGQLGDGTTTSRATPAPVSGLTGVAMMAAGTEAEGNPIATCALTTGGAVSCWGADNYGELGDGTMQQRSLPGAVAGIATAMEIAAGGGQECAVLDDERSHADPRAPLTTPKQGEKVVL
jgi:hypothetical protein